LLVSLAVLAAGAPASSGKGGSFPAREGVVFGDIPYRYVTVAPGTNPRLTVVEQISRQGGQVGRWWYLSGSYYVPGVALDGSGGGLSADGRTLVLAKSSRQYPPRQTEFAIVRTDRYLNHPRGKGNENLHAIARFTLRGDYSFDAVSPDGAKIYLIQHLDPSTFGYEVRAYDVASRRLSPEPIVDPREPGERMEGLPIARAASPDGRWAYTLYDGNREEPFLHALDTVGGTARCIDLPQLRNHPNLMGLRLEGSGGGRELRVHGPGLNGRPRDFVSIDTQSFAASVPSPAKASEGGGLGWAAIGIAAAALAAAAIAALGRSRRSPERA
jgi:hypothetical protein